MSNIIDVLKEHRVVPGTVYYGINGLTSEFGIRNLLGIEEVILEYFNDDYITKIDSVDDYIDYLFLRSYFNQIDSITIEDKDVRESLKKLYDALNPLYTGFKVSQITKFIKYNYLDIFSYDGERSLKRDLESFTIQFIANYFSRDNEIVSYVISNYSYMVLDNYDLYKGAFKNNHSLYDILLSEDFIKKNLLLRLSKIAIVLSHLKEIDKNLYIVKVNIMINVVKDEFFNKTADDLYQSITVIKNVVEVLKSLKHNKYYEFKEELQKQRKLMDDYIREHGKSYSFSIDIKPIIKLYEDKEKDWTIRSLLVTHSLDKKKNKLVSILEHIIENGERSLLDYVSSVNSNTDPFFTVSVVNNLDITMLFGKHLMDYMIHDNLRLKEFLSFIYAGIENYFEGDALYYNADQYNHDFDFLYNAFIELKEALRTEEEYLIKWRIYCIELLLCGLIEKTLRNVYYELTKSERCLVSSEMVLSNLLKSEEVIREIGDTNCKCLEYYLLDKNGVGKNNRNIFAHYDERIYNKLIYDTVLEELFLLSVLSNTLLLHCIK